MKMVTIDSLPVTNKQWSFIMKVRDDLNMTTNEIMTYLLHQGIKEMIYRRGLNDTE